MPGCDVTGAERMFMWAGVVVPEGLSVGTIVVLWSHWAQLVIQGASGGAVLAGPDFWACGKICNLGGKSGRVPGEMAPFLPKVAFTEGVAGQQAHLAPLSETGSPVQAHMEDGRSTPV